VQNRVIELTEVGITMLLFQGLKE